MRILREKAVDRNPDEFHFGMMSSRSSGGVKITERGNNRPLGNEVVKLLKTQDIAYLRTMLQRTRRERERMEEEGGLGLVGGGSVVLREGFERRKRKEENGKDGKKTQRKGDGHIAFVGSREEQMAFGKERMGMKGSRGRNEDEGGDNDNDRSDGGEGQASIATEGDVDGVHSRSFSAREKSYLLDDSIVKNRRRWREAKIRHYEALKLREEQIKLAEIELERQRARMNNSVGGVNKNGVKYKIRERKR